MKTRKEIRLQFFKESNGVTWTNSQEEPDIDYVHWLEDKLINKEDTPIITPKMLEKAMGYAYSVAKNGIGKWAATEEFKKYRQELLIKE